VSVPRAHCRQWWVQNYADLKALNPRFPLLLRGTIKAEQPPQIMVEYGALFSQRTARPGLASTALPAPTCSRRLYSWFVAAVCLLQTGASSTCWTSPT